MRRRLRTYLVAFAVLSVIAGILASGTGAAARGGQSAGEGDVPFGSEHLRAIQHQIDLYRGYPFNLPYNARALAITQMQQQLAAQRSAAARLPAASEFSSKKWSPVGPAPIPNGQTFGTPAAVSGRVTAIDVDPTNPDIVFVGTAAGGVYRSTNGGATWKAIFDSAQSLAIGAIAIAPSQPSTVYVGTGEPVAGCPPGFAGVGLYRIDNADTTATLVGPIDPPMVFHYTTGDFTTGPFGGRTVTKILVDPVDPATIFVGTSGGVIGKGCDAAKGGTIPPLPERGLYRSTNATSALGSIAFQKLVMTTADSRDNPPTGNRDAMDMVFEPGNPSNLIVGVTGSTAAGDGGIYRSTNALAATPTFAQTFTTTYGFARFFLAIDKVGSTVTVLAATAEYPGSGSYFGVLRESTDGGQTWPTILPAANGFCQDQCFFDIAVAIDPANPGVILLGGQGYGPIGTVQKSTNGGTTFAEADATLHADTHVITMAPSNPMVVYTGNDGGIWRSADEGSTWTDRNTAGFSATQFISIAVHPTDTRFSIGGTQDNGTNFYQPAGTWNRVDFGDGGYALIDQTATDTSTVTMYHTYFNARSEMGFARVDSVADAHDGWPNFYGCGFSGVTANGMTCPATAVLFFAPMTLGPGGTGNPNTLYFGSDVLYRSTDKGVTMVKVSQEPIVSGVAISSIGISPQNDNVRLVGLRNGKVYGTSTGSSTLTDLTGPWPLKYVARTVIDPNAATTAYVSLNGYMGGTSSSLSHIWKTTNLSTSPPTWTAINTGLPDVPVNGFVVDPKNSTHLFAGTDIGVYRSFDGGATWAPFGTGLPFVPVFDMAIARPGTVNEVLRIATHGRGLWQIDLGKPTLKPTPTSGSAGSLVAVKGQGFGPSETVNLTFTDFNGVITVLGTATTDGKGVFNTSVSVPLSAALGAGTITGKGVSSALQASKSFAVT